MARALSRIRRNDLLAHRTQVSLHLFATQDLFLIRSRCDDRKRRPALHRDGDRKVVCRHYMELHKIPCLPVRTPGCAPDTIWPACSASPNARKAGNWLRSVAIPTPMAFGSTVQVGKLGRIVCMDFPILTLLGTSDLCKKRNTAELLTRQL